MNENPKKINISGTNNRYKMKRVQSEKWDFSEEYFEYSNQIKMINEILNNNFAHFNDVSKIATQEINRKISSYKQQDTLKKRYDETKFLTFESVIHKMIECELKCRYCQNEMNVLYDVSREMRQWSVDRVDNDLGHNIDNYHFACLECNLKRRRRTDEKFLFTKQLNIVKQDTTDNDNN